MTNALIKILRQPDSDTSAPLTEANCRQIVTLAEGVLNRKARLQSDEIGNLADLALATGRSDLRAEVVRLATDPGARKQHGVVQSFSIEFGQRILKAELKQQPEGPER